MSVDKVENAQLFLFNFAFSVASGNYHPSTLREEARAAIINASKAKCLVDVQTTNDCNDAVRGYVFSGN